MDEALKFKNLDPRLKLVENLLIELASGNYGARALPTEKGDQLDAILVGINMLGEELEDTSVSKNYLESIFNGIVDTLIVLNPDFTIKYINNPGLKLLGFKSKEQYQDLTIGNLLLKKEGFINLLQELDEKNQVAFENELQTTKSLKTPFYFTLSKLTNSKNKYTGVLCIAKEITEVKAIQNVLSERNEELNSIIYNISHEIRGPLTNILGLLDIIGKELNELPEESKLSNELVAVKSYLEFITESSNKLNSVIFYLSEILNLDSNYGKPSLIHFKPFLENVIEKTADFFPTVKYSAAVFGNNTTLFSGNEQTLFNIFNQIISNSLKFKKEEIDLEISIRYFETSKEIYIIYIDNGIGFTEQGLQQAFKPFKRTSANSTTGSGLGLYYIKKVIEKLGGKILLYSKPNKGITYKIFIPK